MRCAKKTMGSARTRHTLGRQSDWYATESAGLHERPRETFSGVNRFPSPSAGKVLRGYGVCVEVFRKALHVRAELGSLRFVFEGGSACSRHAYCFGIH